jgi:dehydrogenase/reductase SDR family member 12
MATRQEVEMDWKGVLDDALEVTVVGSFTSLGIAARRRLHAWRRPEPDALAGRTVLLTGPTSGLGRQAAEELAALGARIVLVGRSRERLVTVRDELTDRHGEDRFTTFVADMGSLTSVREAVAAITAAEPRIDVLIDNAGAIFPERSIGPDEIEATLATLVVGPFALVAGALPLLRASPAGRVIAMSSGGMYTQRLRLDDLQFEGEPFSGTLAYARAKRAQVMLVREWARRMRGSGIVFNAMHPGWADTPGLSASLPGFRQLLEPILRTPAEGVDTLVWLTTDPAGDDRSGAFFLDRRERPFDRVPFTRVSREERRRLWQIVVGLARIDDPAPEG